MEVSHSQASSSSSFVPEGDKSESSTKFSVFSVLDDLELQDFSKFTKVLSQAVLIRSCSERTNKELSLV